MSTNQAFINAYNAAPSKESQPAALALPDTPFSTSEVVMAGAMDVDPGCDTVSDTCVKSNRRPLSQVRAENLFGLQRDSSPANRSSSPQWPEVCQQLLARSADKFDAILRKLPTESPQALIGLLGASSRSGCSTSAVCLALRSSALGFNTLLVDANLRAGGLANLLLVQGFTSWTDELAAGRSVESALVRDDTSNVDLLLTDPLPTEVLDPAANFRVSISAGQLRRKYDRILVDFGCLTGGDANSIAALAAALGIDFLLATAAPDTTEADLANAVESLDRFDLKLAGVIEAC